MNDWYYLQETELEYRKPLQNAIELGTWISQDPYVYFFDSIWIPVKEVTSEGIADDWTYVNIGLTPEQLAQIYKTYHGFNYLSPPFYRDNAALSIRDLGEKIRSIFLLNKGKYLKLLELQGYTYNPLFNVDGVEIRQSLENNGINDVETNSFSSGRDATANNNKTEHQTTPYDDNTYKKEYQDTTQGQASVSNFPQYDWNGTNWVVSQDSMSNVGSESMTRAGGKTSTAYSHKNAKNRMVINGVEQDVDYHVQSKDTAFGEALSGGDKMHNEKYIRQGNIGVTKTQELIDAERQNLKYSIVKEFFDDINAQILVGIY